MARDTIQNQNNSNRQIGNSIYIPLYTLSCVIIYVYSLLGWVIICFKKPNFNVSFTFCNSQNYSIFMRINPCKIGGWKSKTVYSHCPFFKKRVNFLPSVSLSASNSNKWFKFAFFKPQVLWILSLEMQKGQNKQKTYIWNTSKSKRALYFITLTVFVLV